MFGHTTCETMPEAFLTDHQAWDNYISQVWVTVLSTCAFKRDGVVVEVGPGTSSKIGGALARLDFCGTLYVVDALQDVVNLLKPKYQALLPNATVKYIAEPIAMACDELPKNIDVLLSNHVFDDMIIAKACEGHKQSPEAVSWAVKYSHKPVDNLKQVWLELLGKPQVLKTCKQAVIDDFNLAIECLNPACFILSQYPSSTLYDSDLQSLNDHSVALLKKIATKYQSSLWPKHKIQKSLDQNKNYRNAHIGQHVLNAEYWVVSQ